MKKQYILLFVMSIISLAISALWALVAAVAVAMAKVIADSETTVSEDIVKFGSLFLMAGIVAVLIMSVIIVALTTLLGIFGLICSLKRGKYALGCLIMGGIPCLNSLISVITGAVQGEFRLGYAIAFVCFGLYTAGAALAYKEKRKQALTGESDT